MTIPSQNEFLLPFLQLLNDGQSITRSQAMFRLAKHFGISEDEAQAMSGNQFTLVSRLAWCDVHFCKAGFVEKRQHHSDSMEDEFRIAVNYPVPDVSHWQTWLSPPPADPSVAHNDMKGDE